MATVSATEPNEGSFTGAAQTNAGNVMAWRTTAGGGQNFYVSALESNNHPMLPFLLQEAINDGVLGKPLRRGPVPIDLDHINGEFAHADPAILDKIASYIPAGGVMWCGQQNSDPAYFANMSTAVSAKLQKLSYPNGPFKFCYHTHATDVTSGNYPNVTELRSKTDQEADYLADKAIWEGHGLTYHQPGYYNSGSNEWSESTMELFSGDTSVRQDGANAVSQTGHKFRVFRCIRQSSRVAPTKENLHDNQHAYIHSAHGIQIISTWDMANGNLKGGDATDMPYNAIADWRKNFEYICKAVSMGMSLYFHDEDFIADEQSPGIQQHGYVQMQIIADMSAYYKDVMHGFADPTDYIADMSMSMA